jgi:hypothetical protein
MPVSVLLDEAPHDLTLAFNVGGSDQPSPLLPSLLRPAMIVTLHPCSLRDHDTGEPRLCISVTEHPIIVRCVPRGSHRSAVTPISPPELIAALTTPRASSSLANS